MSRIRAKDTGPEMTVRRLLYGLGFRYRLHKRGLPGVPDIVFASRRKAIFVHGCYWHGHGCKRGGSGAKSNQSYWSPKIDKTRQRDSVARDRLGAEGWQVLTVWECETGDLEILRHRLERFLAS